MITVFHLKIVNFYSSKIYNILHRHVKVYMVFSFSVANKPMKMKQPMSIHKSNSLPRTGSGSPRSTGTGTSNTSNTTNRSNPRTNSPSGSPYAWRKINRQNSDKSNVSTVKFLNFQTPENFAVIYLKFKQRGQTSMIFLKRCKWNSNQ